MKFLIDLAQLYATFELLHFYLIVGIIVGDFKPRFEQRITWSEDKFCNCFLSRGDNFRFKGLVPNHLKAFTLQQRDLDIIRGTASIILDSKPDSHLFLFSYI